MWLDNIISVLGRGANQFQKEELFNLLQHIYEDYSASFTYSWKSMIRNVASFMDDLKTKVKIKALDILVLVTIRNNKMEEATKILQDLLSPTFLYMFIEKISKNVNNNEKRSKVSRTHATISETFSMASPSIEL
jgi:hypothetical protein